MDRSFMLWEMITGNFEGAMVRSITKGTFSPNHEKWQLWLKYAARAGIDPHPDGYRKWRDLLVDQEII